MRYYSFVLGNKIFTSNFNPTPLNIQFNFRSFSDQAVVENGFIRLYNPPPDMFLEAKGFIDKAFVFKAGWRSSPITDRLNYLPILNDLLVFGKVTGVLGEYSGKDTYIDFYYTPTEAPKSEKKKKATQLKEYTIQVLPNTPVITPVLKVASALLKTIVTPLVGALAVLNTSNTIVTITFSTINQLLKILAEDWGIFTAISPKHNMVYFRTENDVIPLGVNTLKKTEFISQPQVMNSSGELSAVVRLRPDLSFFDQVIIEPGMIPGFSNISATLTTLSKDLTNEYQKLFKTGAYFITSIEHTGDFYNLDPTAWSTQLTLMPPSSIKKV